jgi:hypothetical protein
VYVYTPYKWREVQAPSVLPSDNIKINLTETKKELPNENFLDKYL